MRWAIRSKAASTCARSGRPSNDDDVASLSTMRPTMTADMASFKDREALVETADFLDRDKRYAS